MKPYTFSPETRAFIEHIPIALAIYQHVDGAAAPLLVSQAYLDLFGHKSFESAVYTLDTDLYHDVHPEDIPRMEASTQRFANQGGAYDVLFRNKRADQANYHIIHGTGQHITIDGTPLAFITYTDETDESAGDQMVKAVLSTLSAQYAPADSPAFSAHFDALTGLANMEHFLDRADAGISRLRDQGEVPMLMYFDLRDLKLYNRRLGFAAGDEQICALAELIGQIFGRDCAARFESDHFVAYAARRHLEDRLETLFAQMKIHGPGANLAVKVGLYAYTDADIRLTEACDRARQACAAVPDGSASAFFWFNDHLRTAATLRNYIISHFDEALAHGWITAYYQPVVRTMTQTVCGGEALARWNDPVYGPLSPGQFIPVLEETGLISQLDLYIFEQVCQDYVQIKADGGDLIPVSMNLSRRDFLHDDLPEALDRISSAYSVPREFTNLEITESAFVTEINKIEPLISRLHQLGYHVWMDDFGTGYSSLSVLKEYPFDELKIDMTFLKDFDDKAKSILTAIVRMAKTLDLSTLAEGVETEAQYAFLKKIGCEKIQGYYFGRPMPLGDLLDHFKTRSIRIEPPKWRAYLTRLSRIDTLTDKPLCIVDDDGTTFNILFANDAYKAVLKQDHVDDLKAWERLINTPSEPLHLFHRQYADQQLRRLSGPQSAAYPSGDHYMQLTGTMAAVFGGHTLYTLQIQYIAINVENIQQIRFDAMSELYNACRDVALYDLEADTTEGLKSSHANQPMGVGAKIHGLNTVFESWTQHFCYLPDRARFADFVNPATLQARLRHNDGQPLTGLFRSLTDAGDYRWLLHLIIPVQRSHFGRAVHITLDTGLDEAKLIDIAGSLGRIDGDPGAEPITDALLWRNLIMNAKQMFFWKDDHRRFLGASQSFLDYFGLKSQDELIGKNDEDMGWHIDPEPFKRDEEAVLASGKQMDSRQGRCIIAGTNRKIVATKIPVYRDGKIVGLLGTVFDDLTVEAASSKNKAQAILDPVTGLANARALINGLYDYMAERLHSGSSFAMIEIFVPQYQEVVKLYGEAAGNCLLKQIGSTLRECAGLANVVGRSEGSHFIILTAYTSKDAVRDLAQNIRTAITAMRQTGPWRGDLKPIITATYADMVIAEQNTYLKNLAQVILNTHDHETI